MDVYRPKVVAKGSSRRARIGPTDGNVPGKRQMELEDGENKPQELKLSSGVVKQATGSAYVELGLTKVLCSVHGPRAQKGNSNVSEEGELTCQVRLAPFSQYGLQGMSSRDAETLRIKKEQEYGSAVLRAVQSSVRLDRFPKSVLEIHILVLSDDGGLVSACTICASLALANSGVELYDLVPSATVGLRTDKSVEVNSSALKECKSTMAMAFQPASESVCDLIVEGPMTFQEAGETTKACFAECIRVYQAMKNHLIREALDKEKERELDV